MKQIAKSREMPGESNGTTSNGDLQGTFRNFDPEDPEYIKDLQRPAAIKEDLSEMERRKRVQKVLESKEFCRELEELIKHDNCKSDVDVIKRLSQLTLPYGQLASISLHNNVPSMPILPIADLRGNENYSRAEKIIRNKLASLYRLVDIFQWSQGIYNHITLRISADNEQILINPFGLLYHEITASSLIKINFDGDILDQGSTKLGINQAGYVLHSAIHKARRDVNCVLHLHTPVVSAVSSMKSGLLPICQEALIIGPIAYHDYKGILNDENEKESIVQDLGDKNVMLLRNHGFVVCGSTAEEALHLAFNTIIACETQIRAMRAGLENLVIPDEKAVERAYKTAKHGSGGVNRSPCKDAEGKTIYWRIGELEWEAWMRVLDNAGYRTGHIYKQAGLRTKSLTSPSKTGQSDIAIPPSASSMGSVDESDYESVTAHKIALLRKEQEKARWLNSPNAYQRIEILETGTDNPKKITKWIQDVNSPQHNGTPVKISSPHQFSPFSINPKEFKEKQKAIKETRLLGATSAGPQSQILDGVTYEEIVQMRADNSAINQTDRIVMIGTASKGIIERQHQHNAQVYRQLYAPNPFASETDEDIQKYMKEVESKTPRPGSVSDNTTNGRTAASSPPPFETDSPSAETISLMQAARQHRSRMITAGASSIDEETALNTIPDMDNSHIGRLTLETTFDESDMPQSRIVCSTPVASIHSDRNDLTAHSSEHFASEDETNVSKDGKKKKKGFFSFGKKKK